MRTLAWFLRLPIHLYRLTLSSWLGMHCRFQPTCSVYALEALERHGPVRGLWLATRRLARCHPIAWLGGSFGYDPVPDAPVTHQHSPQALTSCHKERAPQTPFAPRPKAPS